MSTGADAMGVAAWLTPALIVAVAAGLAHPAVSWPADPAPAASAGPVELIDPDCHPAEAEKADPLLVEEPDGVCPPDASEGSGEKPGDGSGEKPGDGSGEKPGENPGENPGEGPGEGPGESAPADASPAPEAAAGHPQPQPQLDLSKAGADSAPIARPRPAPGARRRPAPPAEPVEPKRRPAEQGQEAERQRKAEGQQEAKRQQDKPAHNRNGSAPPRRRSAPKRSAHRLARSARPAYPSPLARFPRGALDTPEPLPRARRLKPGFARRLERVAERFRVPWELMLAVRRARGHHGAVPASSERLRVLARRLVRLGARKNARRAVRRLARAIALSADSDRPRPVRRQALVRRVVALAHLNRAIGLRGLVRGVNRVKRRLARQVLDSTRLVIYPGGRHDIATGFTDVRVLVLLRYLSSRYREVTVTSLTTGHSFFTASGNVSNHSYGQAVDIAALNGRPILGNQEPGGLTERALHKILLLPGPLEPSELISLFELGGPSFALADHADHIHVGY
jgi:hypothetical protein